MNKEFSLSDLFKFGSDFSQLSVGQFLFTLLASIALGLCFSMIYRIYFRENEPLDGSIARSFPLLAPGTTTIFWLIQYSLPLSLGLLGALSFVRFRTPVKRAEDIAFILLLIAGSLACAVGQFLTAATLVLVIAVFGFFRNRYPHFFGQSNRFAVLTLNSRRQFNVKDLEDELRQQANALRLVSSSTHDELTSAVFNIPKLYGEVHDRLLKLLKEFDPEARVDVFYPANQFGGY
ncbi:MAG: DUF4956 domain-containing protein [Bdellovibrionales bacterium]|nr:DUF4956 domain-containing protein [Bdellovibrionales bacterium]